MDLISMVSSQLGLPADQAEAMTGSMLGMVKSQVASNLGEEQAAQIDSAVPELSGWQATAASFMGGGEEEAPAEESGGMLGGLMSAASGGMGSGLISAIAGKEAGQAAQFAGILSKIGLPQDKAMMAAPLVTKFLGERLPEGMLDKVLGAVPMLSGEGGASGGAMSAVTGALGGLMGGGE